MITPELKSFVEGEIKRGTSRETIRQELLKNGWNEQDVGEAFAVVGGPEQAVMPSVPGKTAPEPTIIEPHRQNQFIEPQVYTVEQPAKMEPATTAGATGAAEKPRSHKKLFMGVAALVLVLLSGGGAYAYYSGMFLPMPRLLMEAFDGARTAKGASYDATVAISLPKSALEGLSMLSGGITSGQLSLGVKGGYDISDPENVKSANVITLDLGSVSAAGEIRVLDGMLYAAITKAPAIGLLPVLASYENKWIAMPYGSENGQVIENPAMAFSPIDTSIAGKLTEAEKAELARMFRQARIIKVTKKFSPEMMGGALSYHFAFDLDREGIRAFMEDLELYINTVGKEDSALSAFDLEMASEELDKNLRDFRGEMWVGRADKLPRKISLDFSMITPEFPDESVNVKLVSIWSGWNEPVSVVAPAETFTLQELMAASFGMPLGEELEISPE